MLNLIEYNASPTISQFHHSSAFIRGIRGPIGSGKSVGCCAEVFRRCQEQQPSPDGKRRSRWAVIRNTNSQLETTTVKTWLDWFPEDIFGKFNRRYPMHHLISFGDIEAEIWFVALDKPDDVKKLLSLELTGGWINEAREVPIDILHALTGRVGRFPAMRDGGPTWSGVIMDTNPPDDDHWWAIYEGATPPPENWSAPTDVGFYVQPPAAFERKNKLGKRTWELNPGAENLLNLPPNYYERLLSGKPNLWIRVYVGNKFGTTVEGLPVYEDEWNEDIHLSPEPLVWIPGRKIIVGLDFGRTPAACFSQQTPFGQWQDIHELVTQGTGAEKFGQLLKMECASVFPEAQFEFYGDPSGEFGMQSDDRTYFDILKTAGVPVRSAPAQNPTIRREAGAAPMNRLVSGRPGYLLSPTCKVLRKGFNGQFRYKRMQTSGVVKYADVPEKNLVSHVHEARQYGYCGGGEARGLLKGRNGTRTSLPRRARTGFNPLT